MLKKRKYLRCTCVFANDKQNDVEMLRQLRLYICDQAKYYACFILVQ